MVKVLLLLGAAMLLRCASAPQKTADLYQWLEDSKNSKTKEWVALQQKKVANTLISSPSFKVNSKRSKNSRKKSPRLPSVKIIGDYYYAIDFPKQNSRGVWKRTPIGVAKLKPMENWESVLDLDRLNRNEGTEFSFVYADCTMPTGEYCLVSLSNGGSDVLDVREFDMRRKRFRANGFRFTNSRTSVAYIDEDHVAVSSDFGPNTKTNLGLGNQLRVMKRGHHAANSKVVLEIPKNYLSIYSESFNTGLKGIVIAKEYHSEALKIPWIIGVKEKYKIPTPVGTYVWGVTQGKLVVSLNKKWSVEGGMYLPGDLLGVSLKTIYRNQPISFKDVDLIFRNSKDEFLTEPVVVTKDFVAASVIKNVKGRVALFSVTNRSSKRVKVALPRDSSVALVDAHYLSNSVIVRSEGYLEPASLKEIRLAKNSVYTLASNQTEFNAEGMVVLQKWATSKDGTSVPYSVIGKRTSLESGGASVILQGYGSYGFSLLPHYDSVYGKQWLEQGGVWVQANVRGGGELGVNWYLGAVKEKKFKSVEDFVAVSRNLIAEGLTTSEKLGSYGGSMGGLLIGAAMNSEPALFKAVAVAVAVLDLERGIELVTGDWVGETGDPSNPKERDYVAALSPLSNIKKGGEYPDFFAYTTATDDRVHPANSRKMVAKLEAQTNSNVYYLEVPEGGHAGSSTKSQSLHWKSIMMEFFRQKLGLVN